MYTGEDWDKELVRYTKQVGRDPSTNTMQSLDDFHIFVLAHIISRPIFVFAEPNVYSMADGNSRKCRSWSKPVFRFRSSHRCQQDARSLLTAFMAERIMSKEPHHAGAQ